jgi:subtilisin family serine protease
MAMKMDFRIIVFCLALVGCGQAQNSSSDLVTEGQGCTSQAIPNQFIVKHLDHSIEVVRADSESEFVTGYMKKHAGQFLYAERDHMVRAYHQDANAQDVAPTIPTVSSADNWGPAKVHADTLWAQNIRGSGVLVAVVDSGMDLTQPQLQSQVYINPGESGTDAQGQPKQSNGIDDDKNGYVDDYAGYDFVANQPLKGDYQIHGTHVSGIVAAFHQDTTAAPQTYVQGMAPQAKVLPLAFLAANGFGLMSDGVRAMQYAVAAGAKVINASWGGEDCSQALRDEIAGLASKNIIFVTAAGNEAKNVDQHMEYPASLNLASQFTIGATGPYDLMAQFSNYGTSTVHIFAPGTDIISTIPGGMAALSGTSMATPFVTGAVALLLSAVPQATPTQVRQALYGSAVHSSNYINASQGRMDLGQILTQLQSEVATRP